MAITKAEKPKRQYFIVLFNGCAFKDTTLQAAWDNLVYEHGSVDVGECEFFSGAVETKVEVKIVETQQPVLVG